MEIKYIEKEDKDKKFLSFGHLPLSYRVSMEVYKNVFTITREYYRVGFKDGEQWDKYFSTGNPINKISFMTRKLENKKYLQNAEDKLIKLFYKTSLKVQIKLNEDLIISTKIVNSQIKKYEKISDFLDKFNRYEKIKKIKEKING